MYISRSAEKAPSTFFCISLSTLWLNFNMRRVCSLLLFPSSNHRCYYLCRSFSMFCPFVEFSLSLSPHSLFQMEIKTYCIPTTRTAHQICNGKVIFISYKFRSSNRRFSFSVILGSNKRKQCICILSSYGLHVSVDACLL